MVVDVDEAGNPVNRSALGPGGSVCDLWMKLQVAGQRPTIITSQVAADQAELARRGILELHADEHPTPPATTLRFRTHRSKRLTKPISGCGIIYSLFRNRIFSIAVRTIAVRSAQHKTLYSPKSGKNEKLYTRGRTR